MNIDAIFFTGEDCNVCKVLKPKLIKMLKEEFPLVNFSEINLQKQPELAAKYLVFTVPVFQLNANGKEYARFIRSFSLSEVKEKLNRLYSFI